MKVLPSLQLEPYELGGEQIASYKKNGFLVVEGLFSNQECDEIYTIFRNHADEKFSAILNLDRECEELRSVMLAPKVVSVVEGLQGAECVALATQMLFKEAGTAYASQAWTPHQDNSYHQNPNGATLTVNIMCDDVDIENGALFVWPGSHNEGLIECTPRVSYREELGTKPGNTIAVPEKYEKYDLAMKKGDTLVLHGNCIHGSYANVSANRSRPMYSITYITRGEPFTVGKNAKRMETLLH